MKLIGLCGYPKVGKGAVCDILKSYDFTIYDKRKPLIDTVSALTGLDPVFIGAQQGKDSLFQDRTVRQILGEVGNFAENLFGDDYLLDLALKDIKRQSDIGLICPVSPCVVDSLRKGQTTTFPGIVVEIRSKRVLEASADYDQYEPYGINYTIYNDRSLEDLEEEVAKMLNIMSFI